MLKQWTIFGTSGTTEDTRLVITGPATPLEAAAELKKDRPDFTAERIYSGIVAEEPKPDPAAAEKAAEDAQPEQQQQQ